MPPNSNVKSDQFSQLAERLGSANNVLVTVSDNPSVDQLASCIGLTLALNKQGKHATAVFSGKVPSTLEFLQPEKTIETNTNSLRDFIISLDKSKADKLRYKVEDDYVKIFITPYKTSIDEKDLNFTQGDFNIDLIITLGVHERSHLDGAIVAHGRILHDATVASLNTDKISEVGTINWVNTDTSSLCEMVSDLVAELDKSLLDAQIATALLTGMVAETDRFGNEKASPHTMSVSGVLMAAGASTQLISNKLQEPEPEPEPEEEPDENDEGDEIPEVSPDDENQSEEPDEKPKKTDGTIQIDHSQDPEGEPEEPEETPEDGEEPKEEKSKDEIHIDNEGKLQALKDLEAARKELEEETEKAANGEANDKSMILDPPQLSGQLTANTIAEHDQVEKSTDGLSMKSEAPMLDRQKPQKIEKDSGEPPASPKDQTLTDIEKSVNSIHLDDVPEDVNSRADQSGSVPPPPKLDDARAIVEEAADSVDNFRPQPSAAVGSTPVNLNLEHDIPAIANNNEDSNNDDSGNKEMAKKANTTSSNTPPPVPPPLMPPGV